MSLTTPTGSLMNNLLANGQQPEPAVGMGATRMGWTDRTPYTIIEVRSPTTIVVQEDNYTRIDKNGMSEAQQYEFSPNPEGGTVVLTKRKNGRWVRQGESMKHGTAFAIGYRSRYYDYSF